MAKLSYNIDDLFISDLPESIGIEEYDSNPYLNSVALDGIAANTVLSGETLANLTVNDGYLQSGNYVAATSGWQLTPTSGEFNFALSIASGTIGGWTIDSTSIFTGTEDHSAYTANAGDMTLYSNGTDASIHANKWYIGTDGVFHATSGDLSGVSITSIPNDTATDISLLSYTHTLVFSASDNNTVAWATGTITMSNGRTFTIDAGNTGNMAALSWIYLDTGVSSTVLQVTTTAATSMGANKIPLAIAQNNADSSANATFVVHGGTTGIAITAGSVKTATLSAIVADLGTITAGTVTGATVRTSASNPKFNMTSTAFQGIETGGNVVFEVVVDGANAGDVIMGDDAAGSYAMWDDSAGTFNVYADNVPVNSQGTFGGDGSDGALTITSGTTSLSAGSAELLVKNYTSISITGTGVLDITTPATTGTFIILKSQGNITLTSSATPMLDASAMGAAGGAGGTGDSTSTETTNGSNGTTANSTLVLDGVAHEGDGGNRSNGTAGTAAGGAVMASPTYLYTRSEIQLTRRTLFLYPGSGGGGGGGGGAGVGDSPRNNGGTGGNGGGALLIECAGALNFTTASGISVSGGDGGDGQRNITTEYPGAGGGGGSAGTFVALYNTLTASSGTVTSSGGDGGDIGTGTWSGTAVSAGGGSGAGGFLGAGGDGGAGAPVGGPIGGDNGNAGADDGAGGGGAGASQDGTGSTGGAGQADASAVLIKKNYYFA